MLESALTAFLTLSSLAAPPADATSEEPLTFDEVEPTSGVLDRAGTCEENIEKEQGVDPRTCKFAVPTILARHIENGSVAAVTAKVIPTCKCGAIQFVAVDGKGKTTAEETLLKEGWCDGPDSWKPQLAAWRKVSRLGFKGFEPRAGLIGAVARKKGGIRDTRPAVRLSGPLEGWTLWVEPNKKKTLSVVLTDPKNSKSYELGKLPMAMAGCLKFDSTADGKAKCVERAPYRYAFIEEVMLVEKDKLAIAVRLMDGTNCGDDQGHVKVFKLPRKAQQK